ncbi:MAG: DNA repair protein RecN [Acidobacteria bacterium]|nr:DNA repair protein RecN [Acidobacteriota bacterium]
MLVELRVENYAVIDNVAAQFGPGLNLLTGETGAGKSLLIGALTLLLGERSSSDAVRQGSERAVISAVFEGEGREVARILHANGLDSEAGSVILRREITGSGKGRVFINNQPATVAVLRQLAPHLAVVHAQNESILAFDATARLALLDIFAESPLEAAGKAFVRWKELHDRIHELDRDEQDRLRLADLWKFQLAEIGSAHLHAGEDERLESEKRVLANAEKVYAAAMGAYDVLYESGASAAALLRAASRHLEELGRYDAKFLESAAALESARLNAEDVAASLRDYAQNIHASPERLAEVEDRLALLDRLKRKYGRTLEEVIAYGEDASRKLNEVENRDDILRTLRKELADAASEYLRAARTLSRHRAQAAQRLEKVVEKEVNDLAMKARFAIEVTASEDESHWSAEGVDVVVYLIAANLGEPLGPVEKIASGGELSRVMLALKASAERAARPPKAGHARTMIFDEIDSGIGGGAAEAVGRKLKALARCNQVLCVTHLPQIASFADFHYVLEKREAGGRTRTGVRRLNEEERTEELARMLSGARLTETSRRHAQQLLKTNA